MSAALELKVDAQTQRDWLNARELCHRCGRTKLKGEPCAVRHWEDEPRPRLTLVVPQKELSTEEMMQREMEDLFFGITLVARS